MPFPVAKPIDERTQYLINWTARMLQACQPTAKLIGCSPAAIVAQAAQESGWGAAAIGNNLFGIKADAAWTGLKQQRRTWEHYPSGDVMITDWFRDYSTLEDGIKDHFKFLKKNTRYADVFDPNEQFSDDEYFRRLQADGYATDPSYAQRLGAVLETVLMFKSMINSPMYAPAVSNRLLLPGMHGSDVTQVQSALRLQGFDPGAIDGDFGPKTMDTVKRFQTSKGLKPVDGIVGDDTRKALNL